MLRNVKAQFLTYKYRLSHGDCRAAADGEPSSKRRKLNSVADDGLVAVYDFQLRDHFVNSSSLYAFECSCSVHKHNKQPCRITLERVCDKCDTATRLLVPYQALLAHRSSSSSECALYSCCEHVHDEPCGVCINCSTFVWDSAQRRRSHGPCLVTPGTRCSVLREPVCPRHPDRFATTVAPRDALVGEHLYNLKCPNFYVCRKHVHRHVSHPTIECRVQSFSCCDGAVALRDYRNSFVVCVAQQQRSGGGGRSTAKFARYVVFDPSIWRDQSFNHFASFVRSIVLLGNNTAAAAKERYQRFAKANFSLPHLQSRISGKDSLCRNAVTGFETRAVYQTSTISCTMPYWEVRLPQSIYDLLLAEGFDLDIAMVKRDPSINTTCMYLCAVRRSDDPRTLTIEIADSLAKGLHQDQDGDKNAVYFLRRRTPVRVDASICWDNSCSYGFALARLELARAFGRRLTLLADSRYSLSENSLVLVHGDLSGGGGDPQLLRLPANLRQSVSARYIIDALSGYHSSDFDDVFGQIVARNESLERHTFFTVADLLEQTDRLRRIHESGAKGTPEHVNELMRRIACNDRTLHDCTDQMVAMHNKCIRSSQDLSKNGRSQFASLYGASDVIVMSGLVMHNKRLVADYNDCAVLAPFLWSDASLDCFARELMSVQ